MKKQWLALLFAATVLVTVKPMKAQAAEVVSKKTTAKGVKVYVIKPDNKKNDYQVIRDCLQSNGDKGVEITLQKGKYQTDKVWRLYNNTKINAKGATITQKAKGKGIFINRRYLNSDLGTGKGGYTSCSNITIDGGTWVGTSEPDKTKTKKSNGYYVGYSTFLFMHGKNITVKNCSFKNNYNGHFVEFAGISNGKIINCNMNVTGSKYVGESANEAIQLDNTFKKSNSPVGNPWDDTPCVNITVSGCKIKFARGIGTNRVGNKFFKNIKIENNTITATKGEGINAYDVLGLTIRNNTVNVTHKAKNYESTGIYIGLDTKVSKLSDYKTVIEKNKITGYHAGIKVWSLVNNGDHKKAYFGTITIQNNTVLSKMKKANSIYIPYKGAQVKKLVNKGNKIK